MRTVTVKLRGEDREVVIDFDGGYEPDTNAHVIEWHLAGDSDGLEQIALGLTEDEEDAIYQQLCLISGEDSE